MNTLRALLVCLLIWSNISAADNKYQEYQQRADEFFENGNYMEAIVWGKKELEYARTNLGEKHPDTLTSMNNLAFSYHSQGRYDRAEPLYVEAVALSKDILGNKHPGTLVTMDNLAGLYMSEGRYDRAEPLYVEILALRKEVLGEKHPDSLTSMNNLAGLHMEQGRYDRAEPLLVETLALRKEVLGKKHPDTLTCMSNLAGLYMLQGRYDRAEPLLVEILALRKEVLRNKHPDTLTSMNNLAGLYSSQGRYDRAEPLLVETLALSQEVLGNKHPDTLTCMSNLANLYSSQGRYDRAEPLYVETLALRKELFGKKHPDSLMSMNNLAALYDDQGHYDRAEPLYVETLTLRKELLGKKHPDTLMSMNNLAALYVSQGRYDRAETLYIETLALRKELLGKKHPDTLTSMNNLADLYMLQGRYDRAEPLLVETLALNQEVLGDKHPDTLTSMNNLAVLYDSQGRYDRAEPLYVESLSLSKEVLGDKHPDTLTSMNNLAHLYDSQGRNDRAEQLYVESLSLSKEVLGDKHPSTILCMDNLAGLYTSQSRYDRAEPLYVETHALRKEVLGDKHPDTLRSMNNLAVLYDLQGLYDRAEPLYVESLSLSKEVLGDKHPDTLTSMDNLTALHFERGQYSVAAQEAEEAMSDSQALLIPLLWGAGESTREAYLRELRYATDLYLSIFNHNVTEKNARRALTLSLNRKGLLLQIASQIRAISRSSDDPVLSELSSSLEDNRSQLAVLVLSGEASPDLIQDLEDKINQQQAELGRQVQQLGRSTQSVTPEQLIDALDKRSVFVDFLVYRPHGKNDVKIQDEHLIALVVSKSSKQAVRLISLGELAPIRKKIEAYREILSQPGKTLHSHEKDDAQWIYKALWVPLLPYLEDKEEIYIAPDGVLNLLPFSSLIDDQGQFLAERYNISMLSSGRDLVLSDIQAEAAGSVIVAAPLYEPAQAKEYKASSATRQGTTVARSVEALYFEPLPGALKEGETLLGIFKSVGERADYFKLEMATEPAIKNIRSPRVLHLATHGYFLEDLPEISGDQKQSQRSELISLLYQKDPPAKQNEETTTPFSALLRSGLALVDANLAIKSGIGKQPGILTAEEVLDLQLAGTELVVLSACDTGVGEIQNGEGVYGLRRAFQEAGAKSILSTLWSISDESTNKFMDRFYELFLNGATPQDALRKTQREFIQSKQWSHPFFWAPYVMVGKN